VNAGLQGRAKSAGSLCRAAFACVLALWYGMALALDPGARFHDYVLDNWNIESGLPQISVISITQDGTGYMWIGTQNGIARFDTVGLLDASFDPGVGFDDTVYNVILQPDNAILVGGIFTSYNQTRRLGIARLYTDGALDTTFMDSSYNQFAGLPSSYFNQDVEPLPTAERPDF